MGYIRTEQEVDMMIEEMKRKSKGKYITQGVSFNKDSARQMELLKMVLMRSTSFSGFIKELLAQVELEEEMSRNQREMVGGGGYIREMPTPRYLEEEHIGVGNFL